MDFGYDQVQNPDADPNASHYSDYGFSGRLATYNFRVDSFLVTFSGAFIKNKTASDFDPANNDFFWELTGDFTFLRESRDTIVIKGTTTIILENTQDNSVYQPGGNIKWQNARLNYHCNLNGTINSKPFNYVVTQDTPLVRDQACSFQPSGKSPAPTHFHPFTAGVANFALANFHPRTINYGPNGICDGSGTVSFKGEEHVVDFD